MTKRALSQGCIAALIFVGVAAAASTPKAEPVDMSPIQVVPAGSAPDAMPLNASDDALVDSLVARFAKPDVVAAHVRPIADTDGTEWGPASDGKQWLDVEVVAAGAGPEINGARWDAFLLAAAVRDELFWAKRTELFGAMVTERLPTGEAQVESVRLDSAVPGQVFVASDPDAAIKAITDSAAGSGLRLDGLAVDGPLQIAPVIHASVDDAINWAKNHDLRAALGVDNDAAYEGTYIELRDATSGNLVELVGDLPRAGIGVYWRSPDVGPMGLLAGS